MKIGLITPKSLTALLVLAIAVFFIIGCAKISDQSAINDQQLLGTTATVACTIYNTLPYDVYITATASSHDWNSQRRPDKVFNNKTIKAGESLSSPLDMNMWDKTHPWDLYIWVFSSAGTIEAIDHCRVTRLNDVQNLYANPYVPKLEPMQAGSGWVQVLSAAADGNQYQMSFVLANDVHLTDWMGRLPDDIYLSEINVPGTHDSGTWAFGGGTAYICQKVSIIDTINWGARFIDLRLGNSGGELWFWHGSNNMGSKFQPVMDEIKQFLVAHPNETILMRTMVESGSATTKSMFYQLITSETYRSLFVSPLPSEVPKLGDVRGKVLLLCDGNITSEADIGIKFDYTSDINYALAAWPQAPNTCWAVGDNWAATNIEMKIDNINYYYEQLAAVTFEVKNVLPVLFISASHPPGFIPSGFAFHLNTWYFSKMIDYALTNSVGYVVLDYFSADPQFINHDASYNGLPYLLISRNMTRYYGRLKP